VSIEREPGTCAECGVPLRGVLMHLREVDVCPTCWGAYPNVLKEFISQLLRSNAQLEMAILNLARGVPIEDAPINTLRCEMRDAVHLIAARIPRQRNVVQVP